jgi:hypothetical protein
VSKTDSSVFGKRKTLAAVFRALDAHTSSDITRSHLAGVCVQLDDNVIRFEATDGHALVRVTVPGPWFAVDDAASLAPAAGVYTAKEAATRIGLGDAPAPLADPGPWPLTDQIVPHETLAPGAACGFDPTLLGGLLDTIEKIAVAFGAQRRGVVRLQLGQGALDPCRLARHLYAAGHVDHVTIVGVVMPMRL